jgi:hypothetical protein
MQLRTRILPLSACLLALGCALPAVASADQRSHSSGGISADDPRYAPTKRAKIVNGIAIAPKGAPREVRKAIRAGNKIVRKPYKYGGGHKRFRDSGYDCSGTVSFALGRAGLLETPLDSTGFMNWGSEGTGRWITVYSNPGHAFVMIAGLRLDTGYRSGRVRGTHPGRGPRWDRPRPTKGFVARHPDGL